MNHPVRGLCSRCGRTGRFVQRSMDPGAAVAGLLTSGPVGIIEGMNHRAEFRCPACGKAWSA